ncbi:MAG: hypothetical protein LBJ73_04285 [Rickettsiales bacterium]|nr:hypothetical protein [Rickettsiales bacterium]
MKKIVILAALLLFSSECFGKYIEGYFFQGYQNIFGGNNDVTSCTVDTCITCNGYGKKNCEYFGSPTIITAETGDVIPVGDCRGPGVGTLTCCYDEFYYELPCVACDNTTGYSDVAGQNYQSETYGGTCSGASCSNKSGTCSGRSVRYRCKSGYYGTGTSCTQCPESSDIFTNSARTTKARGTNTAGSNETLGTCQLPAGTYYDATGTVDISAGCSAS